MERIVENISVPQSSVMRPRDLRSSKQKNGSSFSRVSAARASLGATSYTWMEAADRLETETAESSTTWPRRKKITLISSDDLIFEYDESLLKTARLIPCKGPFNLKQSGFLFQGVFDRVIKRYWGLRITSSDPSAQNQVPLRSDEVIVRVNEYNFMSKSRNELLVNLIDAFSKPQVSVISALRQQDFAFPFPSPSPISNDENSARPSSRSTTSPVSYIKNLNAFNTRLIGQRVTVDLHKLADGGFGISFATRDTCVNSDGIEPIFVERIMPNGAAIHDGRVQFGDRLLSVNGTQLTTFKDTMSALRSIPVGEKATLVFSRQEAVVATTPTSTASPVDFAADPSSRNVFNSTPEFAFETPLCQKMVIKIPVPHPNSGSSSLGIRFEAWTEPRIIHAYSEYNGSDVDENSMVGDTDNLEENLSGVFVKLIVSDGPASKGNLRPGDRLIAVNGHSVIGASLAEISTQLKSSLQKAQDKMARREKQVFLKLTISRFFQRYKKYDSAPKTKSILRSTIDPSSDKIPIQLNRDTHRNVQVKEGSAEDDSSSDLQPRRIARTPSLDSRGRSRRDQESRSPSDSPVRCQSAFTRDGVGRRSVSEKRHAHMNATNFSIFNENVLPQRNLGDDQSRLYATMPASRKIRQIRRSKQGRASGPVKPIHSTQSSSKSSETAEFETCFEEHITALDKPKKSDNDVLRTDEIDEHGAQADKVPTQGLSRSRSHNHSFRAAVSKPISTSSTDPTPPPVPPKCPSDVTSPPIPTRRLKATSPTSDSRRSAREDLSPRRLSSPAPLSPVVNSDSPPIDFASTTAASQHKAFEDFMR
nr:partitioning defective 3 [Hymenolepis microstoma]